MADGHLGRFSNAQPIARARQTTGFVNRSSGAFGSLSWQAAFLERRSSSDCCTAPAPRDQCAGCLQCSSGSARGSLGSCALGGVPTSLLICRPDVFRVEFNQPVDRTPDGLGVGQRACSAGPRRFSSPCAEAVELELELVHWALPDPFRSLLRSAGYWQSGQAFTLVPSTSASLQTFKLVHLDESGSA